MSDLDLSYLVAYSRAQQDAAEHRDRYNTDRCPRCRHTWHGFPCTVEVLADGMFERCPCATAAEVTA